MIHAVRKLARAIHRRSVWQVLAAYLLGSWGVWGLVRWIVSGTGLPAWTSTMTVVLLALMLPLVLATAAVQGGLPGLRIEDEVDPNQLVGLTPEQVLVIPERHPLYALRLFTWRNMVLGGVSGAALLVASVMTYMIMWAFGIGPVGSLMAQGVISERDPVVIAGFMNRTDDPSLSTLVAEAFELELVRSRLVRLATPDEEDVKLTLTGDVTRRGGGYVVQSRLATPAGSTLARFEEASSDEGDLLAAVVRLSERVRERLGESLRSIREDERLAPIATESAEAVRLLQLATRASIAGDLAEATARLDEAVGADPSFAIAWRRIGVLAEQRGDDARARVAYQQVIDLWGPGGRAEHTVGRMRERIAALD